ncbi:DUF2309 domain-containing protein [Roseateles sp. SL47]|uniref:YbcC family protein n=1 Tax=Roseateles sp. SL47 TaxID=2995138 RepID=UPI002271A265|nr:DUF2309 domain-containing protein [Roseateles sp. SL47]WAC74794.1 DUF2309 domain-containing protein [Roseateles sp. SL47]
MNTTPQAGPSIESPVDEGTPGTPAPAQEGELGGALGGAVVQTIGPTIERGPSHWAAVDTRVEAACAQACRTIAPAWPLDRAIAVNPHWERIGRTVRQVAARMAVLGDIQVFPSRESLLRAWQQGRITEIDLQQALAHNTDAQSLHISPADWVNALAQPQRLPRLPLLIDMLDDDPQGRSRLSWRQAITHQLSQTCAAYFDDHQADWQPQRDGGLYAFWRDTIAHDHGIGVLMGLPDIARGIEVLPSTRAQAERWALQRLGLPEEAWADYLESVLLTVNGWASWCAYLAWDARLQGREDQHLRDLLAIRLAWGAILLECRDDQAAQQAFAAVQVAWERSQDLLKEAESRLLVDEVWQSALETGYQRELARRLRSVAPATAGVDDQASAAPHIEVQAAFCIDVRSEPLRRAIESAWPAVQTLGFAGFFGLPIRYTPLGTDLQRPQLPGLLAPALDVTERIAFSEADFGPTGHPLQSAAMRQRQHRLAWTHQWKAGTRWPTAAFSSVEAIGPAYLTRLVRLLRPSSRTRQSLDGEGLAARYRPVCRPALSGLDLDTKLSLAHRVLRAMSLGPPAGPVAPLVLLVGHGSQSANNAQSAALDCGACCGQSGDVNARALARLLNDPDVQAGLRARGVPLPAEVAFVAALHNTTTDEIEGFDLDLLPPRARERWGRLQPVLAQAGDQVRRERAASLDINPTLPAPALLDRMRRRANDVAQLRPEWGLTGNAAFVIAPRSRSLGARLDGRVFLHDYDARQDADGSVLELLMTAPMLVTHWINWQYHASTCDPQRLGSGNKLLHNVVGGRIGVFEGNGGDLRIGLARQSLHDGIQWRHQALRLTVVIDAPSTAIERVVQQHQVVHQLVNNEWLHLWRFAPDGRFQRYLRGAWTFIAD